MAEINTKTIRNICLLGHGGSGKTSLAEAILFTAGDIDRLGKIADKNTALDFDPEETKRGFSMSLAATSIIWHDKVKINTSDVVILSSSAIPGNEKLVGTATCTYL